MELCEKLKALSSACFIGDVTDARGVVAEFIRPYVDEIYTDKSGGLIAKTAGETERKVMLQAHIDEIGFVVTKVLSGGFVRVQKVGGIDIRVLPSASVIIHAKENVRGVFTSTPPHLAGKDNANTFPDMDEIMIDTGLDNAEEIISTGDFATFDVAPTALLNDNFSGKSLDNRTGCLSLIRAAELIHNSGKPHDTVYFSFSSGEELGNRGARTAAFEIAPDEAIAVDVSFGLSPMAPAEHCGILGKGAMVGFSPVLSRDITDKLTDAADKRGLCYQREVMGGRTSTDADVISLTKCGVACGLLSIPLRYMHTPIEVVSLADIENVAQILAAYIADNNEE